MSAASPSPPLFRAGLLEGVVVGVAGREHSLGAAVAATCASLGAAVEPLEAGEEDDAERAVAAALAHAGSLDVLVIDAADAAAGPPESALDALWNLVRAAANAAMIPGERGGKLVFIAPPPGGPAAAPVRAALENMARTLSIEWARYGIRPVAIHPGPASATDDVAGLVAFLASPGGDYFSGCVLPLR